MKNQLIICILLVCFGIVSCKNKRQAITENSSEIPEKLVLAEWLIGKWENELDGTHVTEIWEKGGDALLGKSYSIRNKDTVSSERIRLQQEGDKLYYIPVVKNQNEGQLVKFALISSTDHQLIFENPDHDFPQKISYTLINKDSLLAEISGTVQGKQQSEKFPMRRMN